MREKIFSQLFCYDDGRLLLFTVTLVECTKKNYLERKEHEKVLKVQKEIFTYQLNANELRARERKMKIMYKMQSKKYLCLMMKREREKNIFLFLHFDELQFPVRVGSLNI